MHKLRIKRTYLVVLFVLSALGCSLVWLVHSGRKSSASWWQNVRFHLRSNQRYGEVHIPFSVQGGLIVVQASFSGKPVDCIVDTDARDVDWMNGMHLPGNRISERSTYLYSTGELVSSEWVESSSIKLGDYEVTHLPTTEIYSERPLTPAGAPPVRVILGNALFMHIVLTIDYHNHELIVRQPNYDITKQRRSRKDCLLSFTNQKKRPDDPPASIDDPPASIMVTGSIEQHPVQFELDTGWIGPGIALSTAMRSQLKSVRGHSIQAGLMLAGQPITECTDPVEWSLGTINGRSQAYVVNMLPTGGQVVLGYGILKNYRLTIDYPRQKILLERNP